MTVLTAKMIRDLNRMNEASRRAGGLGTLLLGGSGLPSAGTLEPIATVKYSSAPALGTATLVKAALALTASAQTGVTAGITQPDYPRVLSAKGNASGITGDVVIHGTNFLGATISDTIALSGASEVAGVKAFKTITSIDFPAETHASTDTVSIGATDKIGFPVAIEAANQLINSTFDNAADSGSLTTAATVEGSFYDPAGTLNGTKVLELTFLTA